MSYQRERDTFIIEATKIGLSMDTIRLLLRYATTLQRLAVAQCNGDWPADNGQRDVLPCGTCQMSWVPCSMRSIRPTARTTSASPTATFSYLCKDCHAQYRVKAILDGTGYIPWFQGDPRGAVLSLYPVGSPLADIDSGRIRGIYVPPRER